MQLLLHLLHFLMELFTVLFLQDMNTVLLLLHHHLRLTGPPECVAAAIAYSAVAIAVNADVALSEAAASRPGVHVTPLPPAPSHVVCDPAAHAAATISVEKVCSYPLANYLFFRYPYMVSNFKLDTTMNFSPETLSFAIQSNCFKRLLCSGHAGFGMDGVVTR
jgi:hypothetical protein